MTLEELKSKVTDLQLLNQLNSLRISQLKDLQQTMATDMLAICSSVERIVQQISVIDPSISSQVNTKEVTGNVDSERSVVDLSSKVVPVIVDMEDLSSKGVNIKFQKRGSPVEEAALPILISGSAERSTNQAINASVMTVGFLAKEDVLEKVEVPIAWCSDRVNQKKEVPTAIFYDLSSSNIDWYDSMHICTAGKELMVPHKGSSAVCDMNHSGLRQWSSIGGTVQGYTGIPTICLCIFSDQDSYSLFEWNPGIDRGYTLVQLGRVANTNIYGRYNCTLVGDDMWRYFYPVQELLHYLFQFMGSTKVIWNANTFHTVISIFRGDLSLNLYAKEIKWSFVEALLPLDTSIKVYVSALQQQLQEAETGDMLEMTVLIKYAGDQMMKQVTPTAIALCHAIKSNIFIRGKTGIIFHSVRIFLIAVLSDSSQWSMLYNTQVVISCYISVNHELMEALHEALYFTNIQECTAQGTSAILYIDVVHHVEYVTMATMSKDGFISVSGSSQKLVIVLMEGSKHILSDVSSTLSYSYVHIKICAFPVSALYQSTNQCFSNGTSQLEYLVLLWDPGLQLHWDTNYRYDSLHMFTGSETFRVPQTWSSTIFSMSSSATHSDFEPDLRNFPITVLKISLFEWNPGIEYQYIMVFVKGILSNPTPVVCSSATMHGCYNYKLVGYVVWRYFYHIQELIHSLCQLMSGTNVLWNTIQYNKVPLLCYVTANAFVNQNQQFSTSLEDERHQHNFTSFLLEVLAEKTVVPLGHLFLPWEPDLYSSQWQVHSRWHYFDGYQGNDKGAAGKTRNFLARVTPTRICYHVLIQGILLWCTAYSLIEIANLVLAVQILVVYLASQWLSVFLLGVLHHKCLLEYVYQGVWNLTDCSGYTPTVDNPYLLCHLDHSAQISDLLFVKCFVWCLYLFDPGITQTLQCVSKIGEYTYERQVVVLHSNVAIEIQSAKLASFRASACTKRGTTNSVFTSKCMGSGYVNLLIQVNSICDYVDSKCQHASPSAIKLQAKLLQSQAYWDVLFTNLMEHLVLCLSNCMFGGCLLSHISIPVLSRTAEFRDLQFAYNLSLHDAQATKLYGILVLCVLMLVSGSIMLTFLWRIAWCFACIHGYLLRHTAFFSPLFGALCYATSFVFKNYLETQAALAFIIEPGPLIQDLVRASRTEIREGPIFTNYWSILSHTKDIWVLQGGNFGQFVDLRSSRSVVILASGCYCHSPSEVFLWTTAWLRGYFLRSSSSHWNTNSTYSLQLPSSHVLDVGASSGSIWSYWAALGLLIKVVMNACFKDMFVFVMVHLLNFLWRIAWM